MLRRRTSDELIVTGCPDAVDKLLGKAAGQGMGQQRAMQITHKQRTMKLGLIKATGNKPNLGDMVSLLAKLAKADRLGVALESNCTIGNPFVQELFPWDWELGPWDWELGPWDWELGNNITRVVAAGTTPAEGEALFWAQPALRQIGLTKDGVRNPALAGHTGAGVVVGVFDALPARQVNLPWLTVHPSPVDLEAPEEPVRDLSDHGLMCASLINAVAPAAEVHLYEVCTKNGYGTLYPLLEALNTFIDFAAGRPAILSLSLGSMCGLGTSPSLMAVLQRATDLGMVVCAASGNKAKSCSKVSNLLPAQLPAALANVIAVSSCNLTNGRSTFSQRGDIAAPGGEDLGEPGPGDPDDIIGMGVSDPAGLPSGYVMMDGGTSFATPLVAGAAVLVLKDQLAKGGTLDAQTYKRVLGALASAAVPPAPGGETLANAGLGAGILSLRGLLA